MKTPSTELILEVIEILADEKLTEEEKSEKVHALEPDPVIATRLFDIIPEAFGYIFAAHLVKSGNITFPKTFFAMSEDGNFKEFSFKEEPIFAQAGKIAAFMFHNGPRDTFQSICNRSSTLDGINKAIEEAGSLACLEGCTIGSPTIMGVPAEIYSDEQN